MQYKTAEDYSWAYVTGYIGPVSEVFGPFLTFIIRYKVKSNTPPHHTPPSKSGLKLIL
jgi:hypothetical protein